MSKTLKIIDLLNKIANGEQDLPNKFKYDNLIFNKRFDNAYFDNEGDDLHESLCIDFSNLNDEIEIIEEEPRDIEVCGTFFSQSEYDKLAGIKDDEKIEENVFNPNEMENIGKLMGKAYRKLFEGFKEGWDSIEEKLDER